MWALARPKPLARGCMLSPQEVTTNNVDEAKLMIPAKGLGSACRRHHLGGAAFPHGPNCSSCAGSFSLSRPGVTGDHQVFCFLTGHGDSHITGRAEGAAHGLVPYISQGRIFTPCRHLRQSCVEVGLCLPQRMEVLTVPYSQTQLPVQLTPCRRAGLCIPLLRRQERAGP